MQIKEKDLSKYFFLLIVIALVVIIFLIIKPFIGALLASFILAYIFRPVYLWLQSKLKSQNVAAIIMCVVIVLAFIVPVLFIMNTLTKEAYVGYLTSKQKIASAEGFIQSCTADTPICGAATIVNDFISQPKIRYHIQTSIEKATTYIIDNVSNLVFIIPKFVLNFFIVIFSMFYLFKDGHHALEKAKQLLPLKELHKKHLFDKIGKVTYAVTYGYILVALMQGAIGAIGFVIFKISSPLTWGLIMAVLALIPLLGTPLIWLPAAGLKFINGMITNNNGEILSSLLLVAYGFIFISSLDNFIRPKIIGEKAKIHPVVILVGVLGGISLFGFVGIIIGPLILAVGMTFIEIYCTKMRVLA